MINLFDNFSNKLASIIVCSNKVKRDYKPLPDMKEEIQALKEELDRKNKEVALAKGEWDKTFDTLIDNVVLIDKDKRIIKTNKSFAECIKKAGCPYVDLVGLHWDKFREVMNMTNKCIVGACLETGEPQSGIIDFNGHVFHVVVNSIKENGELVRVIRVTREITDIENQKRKLERRGKVLNAISEMSKTLTNHDNWEDANQVILKQLGDALGVHRAYIYKNVMREDRVCALLESVWCNPETEGRCKSKGALAECVNYDRLGEWKYFMENKLSVQGSMTNCDICPEKERCACINDIVVSAVPIFSNGDWWGFIGFDYHNGTKKWRCDDEVSLKVAADIIGGVLYHRNRYFETLNKLEGKE